MASTPYPWPFDGVLTARGTVLLVVAESGWALPPTGGAEHLAALAGVLRAGGGRVLAATTQPGARARRGAPPLTADPGWAPVLDPALVDAELTSRGVDACYGTDLPMLLALAGTRRVLLAGGPLETCVHSTLRTLNDAGLECLLLADACASADPALRAAAFSTVEMSGGVLGAVGTTAAVLSALAPEVDPR